MEHSGQEGQNPIARAANARNAAEPWLARERPVVRSAARAGIASDALHHRAPGNAGKSALGDRGAPSEQSRTRRFSRKD